MQNKKPSNKVTLNIAGYHLIRLVMAGVFVYASVDKIIHPDLFAETVYNYQVLPGYLVNLTALILPWLELIIGVLLLANRCMAGASTLAAGLMTVFLGTIIFNLARGLDISCGCFSTAKDSSPISMATMTRDIVFLVLSLCLAGLVFINNTRKNL